MPLRLCGKPLGEGASLGAHARPVGCVGIGCREGLERMRGGWWREVLSGAGPGGGGSAFSVEGVLGRGCCGDWRGVLRLLPGFMLGGWQEKGVLFSRGEVLCQVQSWNSGSAARSSR